MIRRHWSCTVRIAPDSFAFTLTLGLLATLPTFGIDMLLPSLSATGTALGVSPAQVGLAMSVYLLSLGIALLFYGPVSDRYGRKPVVIFGCVITIIASIGCAMAPSLPALLAWRALQGAGTAAPGMMAIAIVHDLFDEKAARAKISFIVGAINVVPMIAPTCGAAILALGGWRLIYLPPFGAALLLLLVISRGFTESASIDSTSRLAPSTVMRDYLSVFAEPVCIGYILVNAAAAGAVFRLHHRLLVILHQCPRIETPAIRIDFRSEFNFGHGRCLSKWPIGPSGNGA